MSPSMSVREWQDTVPARVSLPQCVQKKLWRLTGFVIFVLVALFLTFSFRTTGTQQRHQSRPVNFRLLLPASEPNARLCKSVLSAAALEYSTPLLVNWKKPFDHPSLVAGGSHLAKIEGVLNVLKGLEASDDLDIVAVIDGYDVWLQLRPEVLLQRYYAVNERANQRIKKQLGRGMKTHSVNQTIIFSTQKRCWPKGPDHPACYAVPQSSLPEDVYGPETDTDIGDKKNPYIKFRARYLNSGFAIGPVKDMRRLYGEALRRAQKDQNFGSDQSIMAEIFGEQEYIRHVIAQENTNTIARFVFRLLGHRQNDVLRTAKVNSWQTVEPVDYSDHEFGIGLDYDSLISQVTVFAEYDTEWLRFNDTQQVRKAAESKGSQRLESLSADVRDSTAPFRNHRNGLYPSGTLPDFLSWSEIPLFTNIWSGIVPVSIHHNAHVDGMKDRIEKHWPRAWFQPYGRALLERNVYQPTGSIATSLIHGQQYEWWSENPNKGGVTTDTHKWIDYATLCNGTWQELFRDSSASWNDPRYLFINTDPVTP